MFIGTADTEAPTLLPTWYKSQTTGKDLDVGKDWGQEEKGTTKDELVEWHHRLNVYEFEQTPRESEGQGSLACCMQSMGSQRVGHDLVTEHHHQ